MPNIDIVKEFQEIEERIAQDSALKKDITRHLRKKASLLKVCYAQLSDAINAGVVEDIAPNFAKELQFLNNIKEIQTQINDDITETEEEIAKVHKQIRDKGWGWILDNLPQKAE